MKISERKSGLRILQVSAFFSMHGGGIEVVAGKLAKELARQGCEVTWMAGGALHEFPGAQWNGVVCAHARSIDFLEKAIGLPMPIWGWQAISALWKHTKAADIIHIHDYLYFPSLAALVFAKLHRKPIVLTQHIGEIFFRNRGLRSILVVMNRTIGARMLSFCDQVVFVGAPVKYYFERFVRFKRAAKLITNGVDHEIYRPVTTSSNKEELRCLFVGRFVEKKGLSLLRECMDIPGISWVFIGWGKLTPLNWEKEKRRPITEVHENLRAADVVPHYQTADLLVLPSTGEGFPLVLQEALSCGTPVLTSEEVAAVLCEIDERCIKKVELRGIDGLEKLHGTLRKLAAQTDELRKARGAAVAFAQQWSWERCATDYIEVYEGVIKPVHGIGKI